MMETSSSLPRKSSAIFGYFQESTKIFGKFRKLVENVHVDFDQFLRNLRKSSEGDGESSGNRQNIVISMYIK